MPASIHSSTTHTDVLIMGAGPAGYTAAIYAARASLNPILITGMQPGGQLMITTDVENYPGFATAIQGPWLMEQMESQAKHVGTKVIKDHITSVDFSNRPFKSFGASGNVYTSSTVIICTGAQAKWLHIKGEEKFRGAGVSGCATCDGFFYKDREVLVVGGGNAAVEEAIYLSKIASKVLLVHRRDKLRAEKVLQDRLFKNSKISCIWNTVVDEIVGQETPLGVTGVVIRDLLTNNTQTLNVDGVFVAIGHTPNTALFKDALDLDSEGYIITRPGRTLTNIDGIFAAGDVQDKRYRQAVTAAGTGCMAALEATAYIDTMGE
ncbi:thioredoxin-disulfide reductase [Rickettsiales endosymbiont of Peranema trichophorum]|uniref:thioredoxin-disulfide reductase n=1 Tax=Rickettsiales endosymbiont of Peranema trichophorum TaxID=2486577 RepID=UPI00102309BF|nr:thioredoxin-disulfide reductase [Rickettsiales endosymbiont of Peranema trichophorum]RZI47337.1 thioredoxin-disulfide reductase [Rickettsiales endosymbiont of Peranema trichophorum]